MPGILNSGTFFLHHPIARRQYCRTLGRILRWQYLSRTRSVVDVPWIGGVNLTLSRGAKGATGNLYYGLHEFSPMAFAIHVLRPGDFFIDGGANIGSYTLLASAIAGARTVAFEPDPPTARHLGEHIRKNGVDDLVTLHQAALGDRSDMVSFTSGLATMNRVDDTGTQRVSMIRLDALEVTPTLIKLDLEGGEPSALRGAEQTIRNPALLAVICEDNAPAMAELFAERGFNRYSYDPFQRRLEPEPRALPENGIFIRDLDAATTRLTTANKTSIFGELV